ncbi:MAG: B-box zinc finger protein [Acidobacteria bacterium]|nr:B-box zinc finger protein [Acidobacteriota bacterium]
MSCANHPQNPVSAYCRTCGKALCSSCTRQVMGVIYCENCLAERVSGTTPSPAYPIASPPVYRNLGSSGPHAPIAGILAGFFPFGVGAVYCGQYAKGLAHLVIFILLIVGVSNASSDAMHAMFGIGIAAFYFYQLIDAIKSAKAIQAGQPAPDPFGLGTMFSTGERHNFTRGVPTGAVVLIGLGILFLLHNLGIWFLEIDRIWPIFLIVLGGWLLLKRRTATEYQYRGITGPAVLITIGVLSLIDNLHGPGWDRTWPVVLLVIGALKLMERGRASGPPPLEPPAPPPVSPEQPPSEVRSEAKNGY